MCIIVDANAVHDVVGPTYCSKCGGQFGPGDSGFSRH